MDLFIFIFFFNFPFREIEMTPFGVGVIQQLAYLVDDDNVSFG